MLGQSAAQKQLIRQRKKKQKEAVEHDEYEEDFEKDDLVMVEMPKRRPQQEKPRIKLEDTPASNRKSQN